MRQTAEDLQHLPKRVLQGAEDLQEPHQHLLEDKLLHLVDHQLQEDKQPLLLNHKLSLADQQPVLQLSPEDHQPVLQLSLGHLQPVLPTISLWRRQSVILMHQEDLLQHQADQEDLLLGAPLLPGLMAHDPDLQQEDPQLVDLSKLVDLHLLHHKFPKAPFCLWQSSCNKLRHE